jgi:hypothetical protein
MHATSLFPDKRLLEIHLCLLAYYGKPPERDVWDPLKQFIYSLLSSRTQTEITYEVVEHLEERFGSWEGLRDAPVAEIEDAIRAITFPERKAVQLKQALQQISRSLNVAVFFRSIFSAAIVPTRFVCGWNGLTVWARRPARRWLISAGCGALRFALIATIFV